MKKQGKNISVDVATRTTIEQVINSIVSIVPIKFSVRESKGIFIPSTCALVINKGYQNQQLQGTTIFVFTR